ncbi:hypothetical protein [Lentzea sp. NBRC 102530]|uniref:hypothetical protein n=1 Tax=Lentzea sp. NBRC 102530 TaxID=3032201 RepID=UPI0024A2B3D1|nr:hypothetical protein [Lentzea sp. NBRC 102530]GLY48072.1 hypothetical protein Lesp01_17280 [Lentzea sp. NBRC 102530]
MLLWGPRTGGHALRGPALAELRAGGDVAAYGLPQHVHGLTWGDDGFAQFEKASIFVSGGTALTLGWEFRDVWWLTGGTSSGLGMATANRRQIEPNVWAQSYNHGWIVCDHGLAECRYGLHMTVEQVRAQGTRVAIARR